MMASPKTVMEAPMQSERAPLGMRSDPTRCPDGVQQTGLFEEVPRQPASSSYPVITKKAPMRIMTTPKPDTNTHPSVLAMHHVMADDKLVIAYAIRWEHADSMIWAG